MSKLLNIFPEMMLGFEDTVRTLENFLPTVTHDNKFPPYNIIQETSEDFTIEVAIAGYDPSEIDVTVENNVLVIKHDKKKEDDAAKYVYKGIANRSFVLKFILAKTVEVVKGHVDARGVLVVKLKNFIPEEKKPRKIEIMNKDKIGVDFGSMRN